MKPVTYDFDVITDAPAPQRRAPQETERAPQPDAKEERSPDQRFAPPADRPQVPAPQRESRIAMPAAE